MSGAMEVAKPWIRFRANIFGYLVYRKMILKSVTFCLDTESIK
jgi:hypothetical protein